jgi:hypothetical protein
MNEMQCIGRNRASNKQFAIKIEQIVDYLVGIDICCFVNDKTNASLITMFGE